MESRSCVGRGATVEPLPAIVTALEDLIGVAVHPGLRRPGDTGFGKRAKEYAHRWRDEWRSHATLKSGPT